MAIYNRLSELHIFRQGSNWQSPTLPEGQTGASDVTRWHYQESTGLLMSKEYPDGKTVSYTYEVGGRLKTRTWARTQNSNPLMTTYTYDPKTGELLTIDYSDNTPDVTFTYDRLGRQKTVSDYVGARSFSYNSNTLQLETEAITGLYNKTITRTYEISGVIGRNTGFTIGSDYGVTYGFEPNTGRFNSVSWNVNGKADALNYAYLPNSDLISGFTSSNGLKTIYAFENNRNLKTQVRNEFGTNVVSQYSYTYDTIARRTSMDTSGSAPWGNANFISGTSNYITNNLNQYTQITQNPEPRTQNLTYDEDGNLVSIIKESEGTKYFYNTENQLTKVEPLSPVINSKKVEFAYDYMGRRVEKKVYDYSSGSWALDSDILFVYDGWNIINEQKTISGQLPVINKYYAWGLDLSQSLQGAGGIGGLLAAVDNGEAYHNFYDGNGNVAQLVKASDGSIAAHYEYDPYGNVIAKSGSLADENPIRFASKYFDQETELGYWGYRFYSPSLGRWLNRDPIEERGGVNLYASFNNDPVNNYDPAGNISFGFASKFVFHYFFGGGYPLVVWDDGGEIKQSPEYKIYVAEVIKKNTTKCKNVAKGMSVNEQRSVQVAQPSSGIVLNDFWSLQTIGGSLGPLKYIGALKINKSSQCLATCEFDGIVLWIDTADMHPDLWASDSKWKKWQKIGIGKEYNYTISWRDTFKVDVMPSNDMP